MDKEKQVEEILLTPIIVTRYSGHRGVRIKKVGNKIETTQSYYPYKKYKINLDPDMSDFAIGFYEILYKDLLEKPIINEENALSNEEFAGDTMNGFNVIANGIPEAGKSAKQRTNMFIWPKYLKEYFYQYHCLANFWILPMFVGRKMDNKYCKGYCDSSLQDGGIQDYMDRFLQTVKESFAVYNNSYSTYFKKIVSFESFINAHFVNDVYVKDGIISSYSLLKSEEVIKKVTDKIVGRARTISKSKYSDELWRYFDSQGLFD